MFPTQNLIFVEIIILLILHFTTTHSMLTKQSNQFAFASNLHYIRIKIFYKGQDYATR